MAELLKSSPNLCFSVVIGGESLKKQDKRKERKSHHPGLKLGTHTNHFAVAASCERNNSVFSKKVCCIIVDEALLQKLSG